MLLGDYGADVLKIEPPGGDPFRTAPAYTVWNRNKRSVVLDLATTEGLDHVRALLATADVLVESYAPGTTERLGIDFDAVHTLNDRLVYCSITGYGRTGATSTRPGWDALVQARSGMQWEEPGLRSGPIFLHAPLPSFGAALIATAGISAALHAREVTGRGQWVETSLMQGALLWMTQIWTRADAPTPALEDLWKYRDRGPTPCFEAGDGRWLHPMPQAVPLALAHLGRDADALSFTGALAGDPAVRAQYYEGLAALYRERPMQEWVDLLQQNDLICQPVQPVEDAFDHPQVVHNRAVTVVDFPGAGPVTQLGHPYHLDRHDERVPAAPHAVGHDTDAVLAAIAGAPHAEPAPPAANRGSLNHPLSGIRVLDFGTALAGPFGPMFMSDLGADVIKVDNLGSGPGTPGDATYAACHRGKRSIAIDLKTTAGRRIAEELIRTTDFVHYNLRTGVAERLGFGYDRVREINPRAIFCHVTAYGDTGPLATWPGVDQMGQALAGLEFEQGASRTGGHPTWYRFGMCDAATGMLSVIGVLQALYRRDVTGVGQAVETNILNAAMLLSSDAFLGPESLATRAPLDVEQTGLGPLYRLYETADGWICIVAVGERDWRALCAALDQPSLADDPRFVDATARAQHARALAAILAAAFRRQTAAVWFATLDGHGVPCEISDETTGATWFDDPDARINQWVTDYRHPVWGRLRQPGRFLELSATPSVVQGPPPMIGQHTLEILTELGYSKDDADELRRTAVVGW